ncbi:glycosyltransferase [Vibrio sp. sp1]|uniref:rhamnan synthesis F family protein n=1 Tax=Vibrio sp. sp1 TaxID=2766781 RepID=UPI001964D8E2|nr:rhamnan synthesis F family protein [Vibrio sp. sp1]QRZ21196.1 glycosyltransferase [Vibrio sp. sp1]
MPILKASEIKEYAILKGYDIDFKDYMFINGVLEQKTNPLLHYILNWRNGNLIIPGEFNTFEYLVQYRDVLLSGKNPLLHYLSLGIYEQREPYLKGGSISEEDYQNLLLSVKISDTWNQDEETHDLTESELELVTKIFQSNVNWEKIKNHIGESISEKDDFSLIIESAKKISLNHKEIKQSEIEELLFNSLKPDDKIIINLNEFAQRQYDKLIIDEYYRIEKLDLPWDNFFSYNQVTPNEYFDPIEYYLENWQEENLVIKDIFDTEFYLETYPDIKSIGINPLLHFFEHGSKEGRIGILKVDFENHIHSGNLPFDSSKKTIAIVCHESSATGAPLVGLNIGNQLLETHNIIHIAMHESTVHASYRDNCVELIDNLRGQAKGIIRETIANISSRYPIEAFICNSVETYPVLEVASEFKIPTVSLVHEFSEYTRPKGKIAATVVQADKVVVPAQLLKNSMLRDLKNNMGCKIEPNNISILPQGKLPYMPEGNGKNYTVDELKRKLKIDSETKVIIGAGYTQIRKGVDLFVSVASKIKRTYRGKCKFVWVGAGYEPDKDLQYSVWIENQVEASGLSDDFIFLEHQKDLDNILSITDCFVLTSRLDPFPNVVIDALEADVHVACFDKSTGCAEFLFENNANASIATYLDSEELGQKVSDYLTLPEHELDAFANVNSSIVKENLCFENYTSSLLSYIEEAKTLVDERAKVERVISQSNLFDSDYTSLSSKKELELELYIKMSLKGISTVNPKPGFSQAEWITKSNNPYQVPLYQAIVENNGIDTHECQIITGSCTRKPTIKSAVHLHLYYPDLADEFALYFNCLPPGFDLYVTTCDTQSDDYIAEAFSSCGVNKLTIKHVSNIGRDVAPMFIDLKEELTQSGYDVIGHFHSKKSIETDGNMGNRWRTYLLQNLIGSPNAANEILSLFEDKQVGLVFAEDRHVVDFATNKPFADELCDAMNISRMNHAHIYPLGTMFWARPEALEPLFNLNLSHFIQEEPLPYDGSYMHAIERLIPHIANNSDHSYITVYSKNTVW